MKKIILILLAVLGLFACKKKQTSTPSNLENPISFDLLSIPKINKTVEIRQNFDSLGIFMYADTTTSYFEYDNLGRLFKKSSVLCYRGLFYKPYYPIVYYYYNTPTSVTQLNKRLGKNDSQIEWTIGSNGLAQSYVGSGMDAGSGTMQYTTDGFLIDKDVDLGVVSGSVLKMGITVNTYYTDQLNTIGSYNCGIAFFGKDTKNLIKTISYLDGTEKAYTYEFDVKNRVVKSIEKSIFKKDIPTTTNVTTVYEYVQ